MFSGRCSRLDGSALTQSHDVIGMCHRRNARMAMNAKRRSRGIGRTRCPSHGVLLSASSPNQWLPFSFSTVRHGRFRSPDRSILSSSQLRSGDRDATTDITSSTTGSRCCWRVRLARPGHSSRQESNCAIGGNRAREYPHHHRNLMRALAIRCRLERRLGAYPIGARAFW